jgi:hypothetical protein
VNTHVRLLNNQLRISIDSLCKNPIVLLDKNVRELDECAVGNVLVYYNTLPPAQSRTRTAYMIIYIKTSNMLLTRTFILYLQILVFFLGESLGRKRK